MTAIAPDVGLDIADRLDPAFSRNGRHAASLLRVDDENVVLETWALATDHPVPRTILDVAVDLETSALPLDDGRVLLYRRNAPSWSDRREIAVLDPEVGDVQRLGEIRAPLGGYLVPSPDAAALGYVVALGDGDSTIWRVAGPSDGIEQVVRLPGSLTGGVWLDDEAGVLGVNRTDGGAGSEGVAVRLAERSWRRIWWVSDTSRDQILLADAHAKVIVVATSVAGRQRLGWAVLGAGTVHFPETLHRPGYARQALALDDRGERLALHEVQGAVSRLLVYTFAADRLEVVAAPSGSISSPARWAGDVLRFGFSAPGRAPVPATVRFGADPGWTLGAEREPGSASGPRAELVELEGAEGPIEAIVYGGPEWRTSERLVVALHGGPLSAWRYEYEPLFECLSAAGVAVVAPNYRGSTGYGEEHLRAVIGAWGGPDLDDVLHVSRSLATERELRQRSRPVVLGVSYGAFLALLAACHEPWLWSGCVALAPFLSGRRLHDDTHLAARRRVEQLGGLRGIEDALGPRDVLTACASLCTPLLLMHGTEDGTIPVRQSRTLRRRLLELGRTEGVDFEYVEIDGGHHAAVARPSSGQLTQRIVSFCRSPHRASSRPGSGRYSEGGIRDGQFRPGELAAGTA